MRKAKVLVTSLAAALMASAMVLPSAAESSFTPTAGNFKPLFDFDSVPTAKYTDGYEPGNSLKDTIGDGRKEQCIIGEQYGISYTLNIASGKGYKGLCLQQNVTENAPECGSFDPIALNCQYGENKNPGITSGTADALVFWVDFRGFKKNTMSNPKSMMDKGILMYMQEKDYDASGNAQEKPTGWMPKANGTYYLLVNGVWTAKHITANRDFYITVDEPNFCGWVKFPLDQMTYPDSWGNTDADGKFDGKCIQEINLGSGNYASEIGSVLYYDEFGLEGNFGDVSTSTTNSTAPSAETSSTATNTTASTIASVASGTTTAAPTGSITTISENNNSTTTSGTSETNINNPKTGAVKDISLLGAAAIMAAGVLAISRKKNK